MVSLFLIIAAFMAGGEPLPLIVNADEPKMTIHSGIQKHLEKYIRNNGSPIAAAVVISVKTGEILALVQGRHPSEWNSQHHSAVFPGFPAASLFKTVAASAAIEFAKLNPYERLNLRGGCADVRANGVWMLNKKGRSVSLKRAYGNSCNGFFAKLVTDFVGLSILTKYAHRFGWGENAIQADFSLPKSGFLSPVAQKSSAQRVGRFTAGFGDVKISAIHAAWQMLAIANDGEEKPLKLFRDTYPKVSSKRLVSKETAKELRGIMNATIRGGTATYAFKRRKFRRIRREIGGKTGTLSSKTPKGITTWFAGMMPLEDPEVIVSAVVLLEDVWRIKGPNLAAEAFWAYSKKVDPEINPVALFQK